MNKTTIREILMLLAAVNAPPVKPPPKARRRFLAYVAARHKAGLFKSKS